MPHPAEQCSSRRVSFGAGEGERKVQAGRTSERWKLPPRYEVRDLLGKGAYGKVCEAYDSKEKRLVAIKRIAHLFNEHVDAKRILREIAIMSRLNHRHIVKLYDIPPPSDLCGFTELYIVMEVCDTDLKKLCRQQHPLTPAHVNTLLYNLLLGLHYLHTAGVYHRDLTPGNCLVNQDLTVKICDFGLSRALGAPGQRPGQAPALLPPGPPEDGENQQPGTGGVERYLTAHVVTRWYRAPELILLQECYTEAIDVWSAGCIYAELLGLLEGVRREGRGVLFPGVTCFPMSPHPEHEADYKFHTRGQDQLNLIFDVLGTPSEAEIERQDRIDAKKYLRRFEQRTGEGIRKRFAQAPEAACEILERMLRFNPEERVSVAQAFEHRVFAGIRDPQKETPAPAPLDLAFELERDLDEAGVRRHLVREIRTFHPELPDLL